LLRSRFADFTEVGYSIDPALDNTYVYVDGVVRALADVQQISDTLLPQITASEALEIHRIVERLTTTDSG
jgi:hypothetical protein